MKGLMRIQVRTDRPRGSFASASRERRQLVFKRASGCTDAAINAPITAPIDHLISSCQPSTHYWTTRAFLQVARGVHSLVAKSSENKLRKVKNYISSYQESNADPKGKNRYLGLLRNIYHTIPSRFNETEMWEHFLTVLKQDRCFAKLKNIVNRNSLVYPSLLCRQIVFLYYIGLDDEANRLLDQVKRKLAKCEAEMFLECDAKVNEDVGDVIKMLYVLYHLGKTKQNYTEVVLLCDKYICNTKRDPLNNLKYLLYFHLFYVQMNHSFGKMHRCIQMRKHRMNLEQMMFLIRYVNLYLKRLYLSGLVRHRGDRSGRVAVRQAEITPEEGTHTSGNDSPCDRKKVRNKVQKELDIFLGNLLRINKNEKDHDVFSSFDDIVINGGRRDGICVSPPAARRNPLLGEGGKVFIAREDRDGGPTWERGDPSLLDTGLVNHSKVAEVTHVTERDLLLYRDIYTACTNEIMKRVLICNEPLGADDLWNNFLSSMFRDNFIHFMMDRMKSEMKILNEQQFFTYLKQVKLLQIADHPSVNSMLRIAFKHHSIAEMKSMNNFLIADKMTYYTDIFCQCPFVQKYILNMYRQNLNSFNVKILKKILAKLFYLLKEDKSLINGFDVLIKNIFVKVAVNGSFSDIIMVLQTLRQYHFYKNGVNNGQSRRRGGSWRGICHDGISPPCGGPTLAYDEVRKKVLSFFAPIGATDNCEEDEMGGTPGGDSLDGLFHLSAPRLDYMKRGGASSRVSVGDSGGGNADDGGRPHSCANGGSEYHPICEYIMYRTVIEKMHLGGKLLYDKYFDLNIILMMNKQLAKLFFLFVCKFFSAMRRRDSSLNIFDCVNNCVSDGGVGRSLSGAAKKGAHTIDQSGNSGSSPCQAEFPFGDAVSLRSFTEERLAIPTEVLQTYAQKHPEEYAAVKRFGDLLLLTLIDNFLYFELKGSHFIHFFFGLFEEDSWPLCTYHHFFFYRVFKRLRYSQISARDRRCVREGDDAADDAVAGYLSSEEAFERRRQQIVDICREEVMWAIRRGLGVGAAEGGEEEEVEGVKGVKGMKDVKDAGDASQRPDVDCLINLIFCHLQQEDIIDIFRNVFLPSLNDYLKWKGKNAAVKYALGGDPAEGTCSKGEAPKGRRNHHTRTIHLNGFAQIRSLFNEEGESKKMEVQSAEVVRRYEFFYLNMMSMGKGSDALEDPFPTRGDYLCYADFLLQRRAGCSAQDLLRLARGVDKYGPCGEVGSLLRSIQASWSSCIDRGSGVNLDVDCQISGDVNLVTFHVSYLLLLTVSMQKILPEEVAPVLNQIDIELANGTDIPPFWRLLLVQLIYILRIQGLFSFDLLCSKYRQVTLLYTRSIGQIKKERQRSKTNQCSRYSDNIWTQNIVKYLQDRKVPFEEEVHLVDSPFTFVVYVPSMNLFLLNGEKSLFCDTFVRCLQNSLFSHMDSKVVQVHEGCYHWLVHQSGGGGEPVGVAVKG
ncbi:hypothetical protein C922_03919 [Plasmodium inui San Antonio 1]|uniref:Uncharacterized protein n=1 Tax=Plasmodium inui San Antonio 1 TaxID=1237626 RepID=W7AK11_9APIC|nr:hypothetical protein C922_03919 [Plasmodium inui San Antonio 1]EUD65671.1 hypothetical protein C922_03919 [Plasmodium inui San Antonio 1]